MANAAIAARKKSVASVGGVLQIDIPLAASSALNKSAQQATSLYQQCSQLRERLLRVHDFAPYLSVASQARSRQSTDPVSHLWDCLALGVPLCFLFNLLPGPQRIDINTDPDDININDRKTRQRATALFVNNIIQLQKAGDWDEGDVGFEIRDLINDERNTNGFVKVIRTVTALVDRLPQHVFMEEIPPTPPSALESPGGAGRPRADSIASPPSVPPTAREAERKNIINEILVTERKYVGDLEIMQQFANELATRGIIDRDTLHRMFPNLSALLDFQQRFLINMEQVAEQPWPQQQWGRLFSDNEEGFQVYEPYCAHYSNAADIVLNEGSTLQGFTAVISTSELPMFLIKPVQRICKYPLLLEALIKASQGSDYPYLDELRTGLVSVKRIADKINEAERRTENRQTVKALEGRVEDWKGHHLSNFGELLLDDVFTVTKSDVDREYHVFLFEKIILCCKEAVASGGPRGKGGKSPSLLKKQVNAPQTPSLSGAQTVARKRTTPLLLKGRIFLNNVTGAKPQITPGVWLLHVHWKGDDDQEHFTLRCAKEEQLRLWENAINRLIHEIQAKRASEKAEKAALMQLGRPSNSTNPAMPPMHPAGPHHEKTYSVASSSQSSVSSLPPYPGPPNGIPNGPPSSGGRYRSVAYDDAPSVPVGGYYPQHAYAMGSRNSSVNGGFEDDEGDSDYGGYAHSQYSNSGRGTPTTLGRRGIATKSMPPERDPAPGYERARARTEDANGQTLREWTRVPAPLAPPPAGALPTPPGGRPGIPRGVSVMSNASNGSDQSFGNGTRPQLRSQFSSTRLRNEYGQEQQPLARYPSQASTSAGSSSPSLTNTAGTPPLTRSRSASQPSHPSFNPKQTPPPLPNGSATWSRGQNGLDSAYDPSSQGNKRGSGSSQSTGAGSSDYSPPQTMSPITPYGSNDSGSHLRQQRSQIFNGSGSRSGTPAFPLSPPVKVKVHYGEDLFVISVPKATEFEDLLEKVGKKIRLCGPRREDQPLRVRYRDEDGDMVSLASNEDVQLAFESPQVTLYVQ